MDSTTTFRCLIGLLVGFSVGCSTYSHSMRKAQQAVAQGRTKAALDVVNKRLKTPSAEAVPANLEEAKVLFLLERGTILQALDEYQLASRDMMVADQRLEFLDLDNANSAELGKYLYSGQATAYRAPAYERLLLNTLNMANFLAMGDYQGATVEARRFTLLESFFVEQTDDMVLPRVRALGNYLGGVAFEASGNFGEAARYYSHAYYFGFENSDFRQRLVDLYRMTSYQPGELRALNQNALDDITQEASNKDVLTVSEYRKKHMQGDTVVLFQSGMVPFKEAKRVPVGGAVRISKESNYSSHRLSSEKEARFYEVTSAADFAAVNFPMLTQNNLPKYRNTTLSLSSEKTSVPERLDILPKVDVARQVEHAWDRMKGAIMVGAITRLITRLAASRGARALTKEAADSKAAGLIAGLAVYGTMDALDRPDTRSWTTLPAEIRVGRVQLPPGSYELQYRVGPKKEVKPLKIKHGRLNFVNLSRYR